MLMITAAIYLKKVGNFCQLSTASEGRTQLRTFRVGKLKQFKKALKKDHTDLLQCFRNEKDKEMKTSEKLVETIIVF